MNNTAIARALTGIADLLEIRGENPFKVRAYRRATRTVEGLTRPLAAMVDAGADLTTLPGIGRDIARVITELVQTGESGRLSDLEREIPATLGDLMRLNGIGPRRARQLHDALRIETLADLRTALERGDVERIPGFGPKTAETIRQSLSRPRGPVRFRLADVEPIVDDMVAWLRAAPGIERLEPAGSYRRRAETVGDIDLLAICGAPGPVVDRFTSYEGVSRVVARGSTRASVVLASGMQVDLRIVARESYGAALHYFTGNKAHNVAVRALGVSRGLRINEYGVFRGQRIGGETEEDVFRAVGMSFVPPELREDRGEIEAAGRGAIPDLITQNDIRGDLHMHSTWSDGRDSIETMVQGCVERGYEYMAITDHSPAVGVVNGLTPERLERQLREVEFLRANYPMIRIFAGMEVDILGDGSLDLPDAHLERLDIVIASIHSGMRASKQAMTDRILRAIAHPAVDVLAHPTGRLINEREPYEVDLEAVLEAAAAHDVAVELNARPHRLDLCDVHVRRAR
ncbi:MAG TPA: DNA polymerase/3'-5' exonuclease PolX, partial [Longimicrobiales bacterium]|nr:DNA polymerase/3'-5' exonuclease PolX [Longimicrobiales bacterium]